MSRPRPPIGDLAQPVWLRDVEHLKHAETTKAALPTGHQHPREINQPIPVLLVHLLETYVDCLAPGQSILWGFGSISPGDITYCSLSYMLSYMYLLRTRDI